MPASFNSNRVSLLDRGMIVVIAHIRGGNEMGEAWHDDGMLMKKKNTFHDFIDSAKWLVANKWTSRDRLVIEGGSRRRAADGCRHQHRAQPLQGRPCGRALRGRDEHDDGHESAADRR